MNWRFDEFGCGTRFSARTGETDEAYTAVLARLSDKLRVVNSRDANQWILQARKSPTRFESIAYCGTREGLLRRIKDHLQHLHGGETIIPLATLIADHAEPAAWAIIMTLPPYYPKPAQEFPAAFKLTQKVLVPAE